MSAVLKEQPSDVDAFVEHQSMLMRYLLRRLRWRDKLIAEDLLQEIGIRYWRRVTQPDEPLAYLYGIASHVLADFIMERNYREQFEVEDLGDAIEETNVSAKDIGDDIDLEQSVRILVADLPKTHRDVLILHKMYGYNCDECAEKLGLSIHTVEKYVTAAKLMIRGKKTGTFSERKRKAQFNEFIQHHPVAVGE
jgi:RNA polymerase sigma-70 factor (ECF subfamily)